MLNLLGSIAEFERELMLERQREGIAKAKAEGKYRGRQPTARRKSDEVLRLRAEGKSANDIKDALSISRASVFRILATTGGKAREVDSNSLGWLRRGSGSRSVTGSGRGSHKISIALARLNRLLTVSDMRIEICCLTPQHPLNFNDIFSI